MAAASSLVATPHFSIITPSFRSSGWLKLCLASVADQNVPLEHIVQDAGSDDGTLDWLPGDPRALVFIERVSPPVILPLDRPPAPDQRAHLALQGGYNRDFGGVGHYFRFWGFCSA